MRAARSKVVTRIFPSLCLKARGRFLFLKEEFHLAAIIELQKLNKTFGSGENQVNALQDVSISIEQGDIFGIIGLSGAGKSTLVRCINLLEQRTSLDNICFPMELAGTPKKQAREKARELLETVGLPDKADAYPVQLSGGQKQRIAIARALASDPEVLLCDEATSALDPKTTGQILSLLQKINREQGITVILITHQMSVIEQICNRVAILDSGKVAEIGAVEQVFSNPQSQAGRRLVSPAVAEPAAAWNMPIARIAFNGGASEAPVFAQLIKQTGVEPSIMGAATRNVDGKAFGTMLISLPEDSAKKQEILDFLNGCEGVSAEEVQEHV